MSRRARGRALSCAAVTTAAILVLPVLPAAPTTEPTAEPSAAAAVAAPSETSTPSESPSASAAPTKTSTPSKTSEPTATRKPPAKKPPAKKPPAKKPTTTKKPPASSKPPATTPPSGARVPPAATATPDPVPTNLESDLLAEAAAEVGVAQAALVAAQASLSASQVALAQARADLAQAKAEDKAAREALAAAVLSEQKAQREISAVHGRIGDTKETIGAVAREAYQGGNLLTLSVVLEAESPAEFADRLTSVRTVLKAGDSALATLATDQAELAANQDRLSAVRALREELAEQSADRLARSREAEQTAAAAEKAHLSQVEAKAAALAAAEAARAADLKKYQAFLGTSTRLGGTVVGFSSQLRTSRSSVTGTGVFVRPGTGGVTSPFGRRFHPILHYWKLHTGTDLGYGDGIVYAADQGTVVIAGHDKAYGNMLVIDHGVVNGKPLATLYAHQRGFLVKAGDKVRKGQPIGRIGSTGYSTGPHLHFEVRAAGEVIDPWPWIAHARHP